MWPTSAGQSRSRLEAFTVISFLSKLKNPANRLAIRAVVLIDLIVSDSHIEKSPSQDPIAKGEVYKLLVLSDQEYHSKLFNLYSYKTEKSATPHIDDDGGSGDDDGEFWRDSGW